MFKKYADSLEGPLPAFTDPAFRAVMRGLAAMEQNTTASDSMSQLWVHQTHCTVCYSTTGPFTLCNRCHGVAFCSEHAAAAEEHAGTADCDTTILSLCCLGMVSEFGGPLMIPSRTRVSDAVAFPTGWKSYFREKLDDFDLPAVVLAMGPPMAMLTEALSLPLTIVSGLREAGLASTERLVIHLLGAETETLVPARFYEIVNWLPACKELRIVFVGVSAAVETKPDQLLKPEEILGTISGERIPFYVGSRNGFYHDWHPPAAAREEALEKPTIVIAQHSGLHDPNFTASWQPTIGLLRQLDVPCILTSYNENESAMDLAELQKLGVNMTQEPCLNPFRGLRPYAELAGIEDLGEEGRITEPFYYGNQYSMAFRG